MGRGTIAKGTSAAEADVPFSVWIIFDLLLYIDRYYLAIVGGMEIAGTVLGINYPAVNKAAVGQLLGIELFADNNALGLLKGNSSLDRHRDKTGLFAFVNITAAV